MVTIKNDMVPASIAASVTSRGTNKRAYITVHETDNNSKGADASAHARLQKNGNSRQASWHITVDDKTAIRSFPDTAICWHAGSKYPGHSGNPVSIGVEICVNSDGNYRKAVDNAAQVVAYLMKQNGIPLTRVVQHNHWSGKNCPRHLRSGDWGVLWSQFIGKVSAASGNVTTSSKPTIDLAADGTVLKYGDSNKYVTQLQKDLSAIGIETGIDGSFGNDTKNSVLLLQRRKGLETDGIAGPATQAVLKTLVAERAASKPDPKPAPTKPTESEVINLNELYKPSAKAMVDSTLRVLSRLERKGDDAIDPQWRIKLIEGKLTVSDALALLFVAYDRQLFDSQRTNTPE